MLGLEAGATFAGYRIDGLAGRGGMGVVYRATQLELKRAVALKLLSPELTSDVRFRDRFKRESELAAAIDHPNVIPIYEAGEAEGQLFIAMRYVDGHDLEQELSKGRLEPERAVQVIRQVAAALDAAHRRGLVHRDVKPANVMLTDDDEAHVYLMDFGLTKSTAGGDGLTMTGQFVGTVDYAAPEQIRGEAADARTDVYALGCLLYRALTGSVPFERQSVAAAINAHLSDQPPALPDGVPEATGLAGVIERALAKDPGERYANAGDLGRAALAAVGGDRAAPAPPAPPPQRNAQPRPGETVLEPAEPAPPPPPPPPSGPDRRRLALTIGLPALLAGIAIALLIGLLGGGDDEAGGLEERQSEVEPELAASIPVGGRPEGIAFDDGSVFVADREQSILHRIDATSGEPAGEPVPVAAEPTAVAGAGGAVWTAGAAANAVQRLQADPDPVPAGEVPVGAAPSGISLGQQLVWVTNAGDGTVSRVDRAQPAPVGGPIGVGSEPADVFVGPETVWIANSGDGTVTRINPSTAQVVGDPIAVGANPRAVTERFGSAWVANADDNTVTRLDAETGEVVGDPIAVGSNPRAIDARAGFVWVANTGDGTVSRIDPRAGRVVGEALAVGGRPSGVAVGGGSVWVTVRGDGAVARIDIRGD